VIEDLLKGQDSGILTYSSDMTEEVTMDAQQTPNFGRRPNLLESIPDCEEIPLTRNDTF